jgi:hypothetical protein
MNNIDLEKTIRRIISELSDEKGYICSIDVLLGLNYLTKTDYEKWRNGQVDYLERVCQTNLGKLTTINKIIRQVAAKMNLVPSLTVYNKWGKGPKQKLRFSKSGDFNIEKAYSTHFLNKYQIEKLKENKKVLDDNDN